MTLRPVTGRLRLPPQATQAAHARLLVEVLDTSQADAPSLQVAQQRYDVVLAPGGALDFALNAPPTPAGRQYTLAARVNLPDGQGGWRLALLTTQSHPLPAAGAAALQDLPLTWVG